MSTCDKCKFWRDDLDYDNKALKLRRCKKIKLLDNSTEWRDDGLGVRIIDKDKDLKAFTQDGSSYKADLLTMGDFGCNQFKGKDEPTNTKD